VDFGRISEQLYVDPLKSDLPTNRWCQKGMRMFRGGAGFMLRGAERSVSSSAAALETGQQQDPFSIWRPDKHALTHGEM
jgi:hypothetical protein